MQFTKVDSSVFLVKLFWYNCLLRISFRYWNPLSKIMNDIESPRLEEQQSKIVLKKYPKESRLIDIYNIQLLPSLPLQMSAPMAEPSTLLIGARRLKAQQHHRVPMLAQARAPTPIPIPPAQPSVGPERTSPRRLTMAAAYTLATCHTRLRWRMWRRCS